MVVVSPLIVYIFKFGLILTLGARGRKERPLNLNVFPKHSRFSYGPAIEQGLWGLWGCGRRHTSPPDPARPPKPGSVTCSTLFAYRAVGNVSSAEHEKGVTPLLTQYRRECRPQWRTAMKLMNRCPRARRHNPVLCCLLALRHTNAYAQDSCEGAPIILIVLPRCFNNTSNQQHTHTHTTETDPIPRSLYVFSRMVCNPRL